MHSTVTNTHTNLQKCCIILFLLKFLNLRALEFVGGHFNLLIIQVSLGIKSLSLSPFPLPPGK